MQRKFFAGSQRDGAGGDSREIESVRRIQPVIAGPKHMESMGRNIASRNKNKCPSDSRQVNRDLSPTTKRNQIQPKP